MIILEILAWAALIVMVIIGILAIGMYMLVKDIADSVDYIKNHVVFIANLVPKHSNYKSLNYSKVEMNVDRIKEEIKIIEEDISGLYLRIKNLEEKKND